MINLCGHPSVVAYTVRLSVYPTCMGVTSKHLSSRMQMICAYLLHESLSPITSILNKSSTSTAAKLFLHPSGTD